MTKKTSHKKKVMVVHPATQHSYQAALGLQTAGLLQKFVTGFYYKKPGLLSMLVQCLPTQVVSRLERYLISRRIDGLNQTLIADLPFEDLLCVICSRIKALEALTRNFSVFQWRMEQFEKKAADFVIKEKPRAVICYDSCCLKIFEAAKKVGANCILDQTIGHMTSAAKVFNQWNVPTAVQESLVKRSLLEVELADKILSASEYVSRTLLEAGVPASKIAFLPYGVDSDQFCPGSPREDHEFRVLFVGRLNHRKGIQFVMDALEGCADLPDLKLWLAGPVWGNTDWMNPYKEKLRYFGQIPHVKVHEIFQKADMFLYPSLHEGSALTIYEALASGLPVVTTFNSGSVARDKEDGFIVPLGDVGAMVEKMHLLYQDRSLRIKMGQNARLRAQQFSWEIYRNKLAGFVESWIP